MDWLNKISLETSAQAGKNVIQVVGHNPFLNELLAKCLVSDAKLHCRRSMEEVKESRDLPETCLVFIDSTNIDLDAHWEEIMAFSLCPARTSMCALFNVDPELGIDVEAMRRGVRGLFFRNDSPETIAKGIRKILEGEIWYRREALFNCIARNLSRKAPLHQADASAARLTVREKKILRCLSRGASNQDIADHMVVSIHTIKSHLYKIYKKINVPNRFQATLWAQKNLEQA